MKIGYDRLNDFSSKSSSRKSGQAKKANEYAKNILNGYDGIYIHRNWANFRDGNNVYTTYMQKKQEEYSKMKSRFMNNYLNSISIDSDSIEDLVELSTEDKEQVLNDIDKELQDNLIKGIENAVKTGVDSILANKNLAYKVLNDAFSEAEVNVEKLETLLSIIDDTGKIIANNAVSVAALITGVNKKNNKELPKGMQSILKEKDLCTISGQDILQVSNDFKNLQSKLKESPPELKTIRQYLNNIFSTDFGEAGSLIFILKELEELIISIEDAIWMGGAQHNNAELTGELKNLAQSGVTTTYKTDIGIKNLTVKINENDMSMNLGFSVKTYKAGDKHVQITGEVHLSNRLSQLFNNNAKWNNIMYNTLAHTEQDPQSYAAIKQLLVARNLDVAMAGLGLGLDFSQFLLVNGSFYSTWEIVKAIEKNNYGGGFRNTTDDVITVNFAGIRTVEEETKRRLQEYPPNYANALDNSKRQIYTIDNLQFSMNFFPSKLKSILNK